MACLISNYLRYTFTKTQMTKVKIKAEFEVAENEDDRMKQSTNQKLTDKIIEYPTVPRIGE